MENNRAAKEQEAAVARVLRTARDVKEHFDREWRDRGMGTARRLAELPADQVGSAIHQLSDDDRKALFNVVPSEQPK